jgi:hypothetical protein
VILSDHDLAVIAKAVARARQDGKNDRHGAAAGQPGPGPCPGPPAEAPRCSAPPPAMTQALPAANPMPPWSAVLANTIRLWAARRRFWPATMRWRVTSALIVAAVLFCGGAVTVALARGTVAGEGAAGSARPAGPRSAGTGAANGGQPPGGAAIAAAAAARTAAAAWMARQVAPAAIVACDPQPARARIAGRPPRPGRRDLAAGQVDTRLLSAIGALATPYHVDVTGFGAPAAGASPGLPLRSADLSPAPARRGRDAARLNSVKRFLLAQQAPFRPADVTTVRLASGQTVLHVEFTAPGPLGLLGAPH